MLLAVAVLMLLNATHSTFIMLLRLHLFCAVFSPPPLVRPPAPQKDLWRVSTFVSKKIHVAGLALNFVAAIYSS